MLACTQRKKKKNRVRELPMFKEWKKERKKEGKNHVSAKKIKQIKDYKNGLMKE